MNKKNKNLLYDSIITFLCLIVAYQVQHSAFINWDVAWHVEGARRLLAGGHYLLNTFDNNSPLVFAYFFPLIWLTKVLTLPLANLALAYITLTALIPLSLCYYVLNQCFNDKDIVTRRLLYFTLVYCLLFLPAFNFGHREIVLFYFFIPYFMAISFSTYIHLRLNRYLLYLMAFLAAYGITQNLLYLSIPIFIDLYRLLKRKTFTHYQFFFYSCVAANIAIVAYLYPDYFAHIIPMVLCYESGFNFPITVLLLEILTFTSLLTVTTVLINFNKIKQSDDIILCFIATICSLLIYFFELKLWYYHLYPALCFVIFSLILLIAKYYEEVALGLGVKPRINLFTASLAGGILATIFLTVFNFLLAGMAMYHNPQDITNKWIRYAEQHFANKKLYFLVIRLGPPYSLTMYTHANIKVVSPWSNPWMLPYIILHHNKKTGFCNLRKDSEIFIQVATNALVTQQPDFIITEDPPRTLMYRGQLFDYFRFFSDNKLFAQAIKNYVLYDRFYSYHIYQRRAD